MSTIRSHLNVLLFCLCLCVGGAPELHAQQVLHTPSGDDLAIIAYAIAGEEPPFATWGAGLRSVAGLNEFKRPEAAKAAEQNLRKRAGLIRETRVVDVSFYTQFGEYNDNYHEFDLNIDDSTAIQLQSDVYPRGVSLHLINGGLAQSWPLSREDAAKIAGMVGSDRTVFVSAKIELGSATVPATGDTPININGTVLEYDVISSQKHLRLGHVVVH